MPQTLAIFKFLPITCHRVVGGRPKLNNRKGFQIEISVQVSSNLEQRYRNESFFHCDIVRIKLMN